MARSKGLRFAVVAGVLVLVAGCNTILGLSDYEDGECSGQKLCPDAGAEEDASEHDAPPPLVDASGTAPVRWAQFRMPNYDQDGGPRDNLQNHTVKGDAIFDEVSGLTWRDSPADEGLKSWSEANEHCAEISTAALPWRLPSRIELVTLLDLTPGRDPTIGSKFRSKQSARYWTLSEVRPYGANGARERWTVDFSSGFLKHHSEEDGKAAVRCILDRR